MNYAMNGYKGDAMKTNKHFLMDDIFDYLMENDQTIGTNIREEFADCSIDFQKGIIYLRRSKTLPNFKITIEEDA